jgi:hypothetical protein
LVRILVVVGHAAGIHGHVRRLAVGFDGSSVSPGRPRKSRGVFEVADAREVRLKLSTSDRANGAAGPVSVSSTQ